MRRTEMIDQILAICRERFRRCGRVDIAAIVHAYHDLMPELEQSLERLRDEWGNVPTAAAGALHADSGGAGVKCPSATELQALMQGTIPPEDRARIEEHLRSCDDCRREWEERQAFDRLVRDFLRRQQGEPPLPEITIPNHELTRWIGRGGYGDVWLARHTTSGEERAVKIVHFGRRDPRGVERFRQEMQVVLALGRPRRNRVILHDYHVQENYAVLVMEYIAGGPLSKRTSVEAPMPWERACRYVADVADGLTEIHHRGVLHRDIKPSNILLDETYDDALLGDFGLAALAVEARDIVGTPGYVAPELFCGPATAKSDVFSLAATLFHLVAGHPPFPADDLGASLHLAAAGLAVPVPALRNVSKAVEEAILAGLEPDSASRLDLRAFLAAVRGARLAALADQLRHRARQCGVKIEVEVSAGKPGDRVFRRVPCLSQPLEPHRNPDKVPEPSPVVVVETGDLVSFDVRIDTDGYLTVLNLASSGEIQSLFPNPSVPENRVRAGQAQRLVVQLTPPAGTERTALVWTRRLERLNVEQWRARIEGSSNIDAASALLTRNAEFVLHETVAQPADDWAANVVTVMHHEGLPPGGRSSDLARSTSVRGLERKDSGNPPSYSQGATHAAPDAGTPDSIALPAGTVSAVGRHSSRPDLDLVHCSLFAPPGVARGASATLQVLVHRPPVAADAQPLARQHALASQPSALRSLEAEIGCGERLFFELTVPGLQVKEPIESLVWNGQTASIQFEVAAASDCPTSNVIGTVQLSLGEGHAPIGHVKFRMLVTAGEFQDVGFRVQPIGEAAHRYRKAFLSFASADRSEVLKRIAMLEALNIEFFPHALDPPPRERWERGLYRQIDECDLFLLFWSTATKNSCWVLEEVRYAVRRKQGDDRLPPEILPVLLKAQPPIEPPEDLKHLNLNGRLMYYVIPPLATTELTDKSTLSGP